MDMQTYTNWKGYNTFYLEPLFISKLFQTSKTVKQFKNKCNRANYLIKLLCKDI